MVPVYNLILDLDTLIVGQAQQAPTLWGESELEVQKTKRKLQLVCVCLSGGSSNEHACT